MVDRAREDRIRHAAMAWLDMFRASGAVAFRFEDLNAFTFDGVRVGLMDRQRGIRKPAQLAAALSVRTAYTPPGEVPPYRDAAGPDGLLRYKYRGDNPQHPDNRALRAAYQYRLPVIWFIGIAPGYYTAVYPVWIVGDESGDLQFVLALDEMQTLLRVGAALTADQRQYVERLTRQRVHQPVFRAQVLHAYDQQCAMCRLRYPSLLDAAHILPDAHPRGTPEVPNGLALCKIHHAAFDQNLLGVRPDFVVVVRPDIREDSDGPMLTHGLQAMDGVRLHLPTARKERPDPGRLAERYAAFLASG